MPAETVQISHYSDILCVWAYVSQIRLDELRRQFPAEVAIRTRFCSVFPDVAGKLEKRGVAGFRAHVAETVARFDHVSLHPDLYTRVVPTTSATVHAFVKAAELAGAPPEPLAWALRLAFFRDGRDISQLAVQLAVATEAGLALEPIRAFLDDGRAWAALLRDYDDAAADHVRGSPTYLLNERRQILFGNVGYKIIEANVHELLHHPEDRASWC